MKHAVLQRTVMYPCEKGRGSSIYCVEWGKKLNLLCSAFQKWQDLVFHCNNGKGWCLVALALMTVIVLSAFQVGYAEHSEKHATLRHYSTSKIQRFKWDKDPNKQNIL